MRRLITTLLLCCSAALSFGQTKQLSPNAEIYLLTIGPGEELYSSWGHTTLLIEDYAYGMSEMYNYGSFDFETDNFYVKFLRGTLPYYLSKSELGSALSYWSSQNRLVTKQRLRMSLADKQKIYELIEENYLPQNSTYQYKFFYDNCATRIRDLIVNVMGKSLILNKNVNADKSYRDWIQTYAGHKAIADFGMDIAIGIPADEITGYNGAMYVPDNLMYALDSAKVKIDGKLLPVVADKTVINALYVQQATPKKEMNIPLIVSILLLLSSIYYAVNGSKEGHSKKIGVFNKVLFVIAGIAGVILTLLWFFTDHGVTMYNLNVLWANPFYLLLFTMTKRFGQKAFLITALISATTILVDILQIQDIPLAADFIALALAVRLYTIYKNYHGSTSIPNRAV